jgi:hypothetical protein
MFSRKFLAALLIVGNLATLVRASDDLVAPEDKLARAHWEFGVQTGLAVPVGNKSTSILANNSAFLVSDPATLGEDEFRENGLASPDFTAQTQITGTVQPSAYVGGHGYYRLTSWMAAGIEGSFMIQRNEVMTAGGPFAARIYNTDYSYNGAQVAPSLRFGGWIGGFRPYVMAGAGPYYLSQRVTSELNDPDDPEHPPIVAAQTTTTYLSAIWGGGIDFKFFSEGSIGLAVQYQRIFMPGNNLQFFIPTLRFDAHF